MAQRDAVMWLVGLLVVQIVVSQQPTITKSDGKILLNLEYVNQPVLRFNPIHTNTFEPVSSIAAELEPNSQPEPTPKPTTEPQPEQTPEPEPTPEATPEPTTEPQPEQSPEPTPEPKPETAPEPEPTPKPKRNPKPKLEEITTDQLYQLLQFFNNFV